MHPPFWSQVLSMCEDGDIDLLCERRVHVRFPFLLTQTQLLSMCSELETHVKCDIRESEKCLYRSKVSLIVIWIQMYDNI